MQEGLKKKTRNHRIAFIGRVVILFVCILLFSGCKNADQASKAKPAQMADFFFYTDSENRLYVWREGGNEPILLTDCAFSQQGEDPEASYWETWEYWEEWEEEDRAWIRNEEKALQDLVWEMPDKSLLFPENMRWATFQMQRGKKEREEALAYMTEEELGDWADVRVFCYDLCLQGTDAEQGSEKLAGNVLFYSVDEKGGVWYCQAVVDESMDYGEEGSPCAQCILYWYDGTEHQKIGEIDGRKKEPYRVEKNGESVAFYGMDDSLYRCRPGEEPRKLAEGVDSVLYWNDEKENLVYTRNGSVFRAWDGKEETEVCTGEEGRQSIGVLGKEGNVIFVLEAEKDVRYSDWIALDVADMDGGKAEKYETDGREVSEGKTDIGESYKDSERLRELLEQKESIYYPFLCTVSVMDISVSPAEIIDEIKGYVLTAPLADEKGNPKDVYYMEMVPEESFEKIPLSELLGNSLPGDVLYTFEYYLDNYGKAYEDLSFAWALEACWELEAIEKRMSLYTVTASGIRSLEGLGDGLVLGTSRDYDEDGTHLYLMQYQSPEMESDYRRYGHHYYYGYLENRYELDGEGNCRKVVELADETAVFGNEVFYSRNKGLEGYVTLYGSNHEEALASAADLSLESLKKSEVSDSYLFLAEGLMDSEADEKEGAIPVYAWADLRNTYRQAGIERDWFSDEENLHTLVFYRENTARELEKDIYGYAFYGTDSVWMLQYNQEEKDAINEEGGLEENWTEEDWMGNDWEEEEKSRIGNLFVFENGEKRKITDQAVWVMKAGSGKGSRSASWVFE